MGSAATSVDQTALNWTQFQRLIEEGFNQGRLNVVDEVISDQHQEHQSGMGPGPEGVKGAITYLHSVFPDFRLTVEAMTIDGDTIWARLKGRGTQLGPHMGMEPTGRQMEIDVIDICRFEDGMMVEHWGVPDRFTMMEQLGLLPGPDSDTLGLGKVVH